MKTTKLNNNLDMPTLGIGTFMLTPDQAEEAVCHALKDGYRLYRFATNSSTSGKL